MAHAQAFNKGMEGHNEYTLAEHLEPYPYFGNPNASIFVLLANPGISKKESDPSFRDDPENVDRNRRNLRHESADSYLSWVHSPESTESQREWVLPRIRNVVHETSLKQVSNGLFFVNYHPYSSKAWYRIPYTFETQCYSFHLVNEAMKRNALMIMSRNMLGWYTAIPELHDYGNRVKFKSSRSVHISQENLGTEVYQDLLKRL